MLGGTAEARSLARALSEAGVAFASSLAGRVSRPRLPVGPVRVGGFGGVDGLAEYLRTSQVTHLVDATHPFAATMSGHAVAAAELVGIPVVRLARPGWAGRPDASSWHWAADLDEVRRVAEGLGERPFVTTGRQTLHAYAAWTDRDVLVRIVEPLTEPWPARWRVIEDRGPYEPERERDLLQDNRIDVLLTKDSGGSYTEAKLDAAAALQVPVVVLRRPAPALGALVVTTVEGCLDALSVPQVGL